MKDFIDRNHDKYERADTYFGISSDGLAGLAGLAGLVGAKYKNAKIKISQARYFRRVPLRNMKLRQLNN